MYVSILIDSGDGLSYISPRVVEICKLLKEKQKGWMVGISSNKSKRKVTELVKYCKLSFSEMDTTVKLNILPLGYWDILIGMDW